MRRLAPFVLVFLLAGCATSRVDFTPEASDARVSEAEVAAGDALYPIVEAGKWGYINRRGEVVMPPRYDFATDFSEGRAAIRQDKKWGYLAPDGTWAIEPVYDTASPFSEGRAVVGVMDGKTRRFGFIDSQGAVIVPTVLPYALSFSDGLALVRLTTESRTSFQALLARLGAIPEASGYVFLDRNGDSVFDVPGVSAASFSGGLAPFEESNGMFRSTTWGYMDTSGNVVVEPTLDGPAFRYSDGLARVAQDGRLGFVDRSGAFVIAPEYDLAFAFSEGFAPVQVGDLWGYVNEAGEVTIEPRFRQALAFSGGIAPVQVGSQWGYVNESGALAIEATYSRAEPFARGLARVYTGRLLRYIDASGEVVWAQQ